ncbi:MAG: YqgE/AlgH family protein [Rhizobiaceae bacterium]|nr:YqgE/AlgH family protein [Rhizobiaceae bacterium]
MDETLSLTGQFLIAMPGMGDQRFEKSVIFVCAHSEDGAMGFIVNQAMAAPNVVDFFNKLEIVTDDEQDTVSDVLANLSLNMGGPVEPGRGFVLHTPDYESDTSLKIGDEICLTATLEILRAIAMGRGPEKILLALGYSGWGAGQLESEIISNGWLTCQADQDILFDQDHGTKYERALATLGIDPLLLSSEAGHA